MYHIIIHCKPKESNEEHFGKVKGAYASILLDYKDYDGVVQLSKFYINEEGWEFIEFDNETKNRMEYELFEINVRMVDDGEETDSYFVHY